MESRVPLPTDNIYKFYALFGLLLLIFSVSSLVYVNHSTNTLAFDIAVEYTTLAADPVRSVSEEARFQVLDNKLKIAKTNKTIFLSSLGVFAAVGLLMIWYGFRTWHLVVQPLQDELLKLNIEKLKQDLVKDNK
ncbi:hypothetical protein [Vibrio parahaemolyticus]|uniref:hypothetical protein n=1 Tax=Vibrio parahaemolyticus TaxID=670 RepID=UPI001124B0F0|nr:hypothetical protein [Vibrio parahaemolyticus]TNY81039.1 hypothetical protein CGK62_02065 [Vibrio parahaemolyticus]